jgi:hypothetical protein
LQLRVAGLVDLAHAASADQRINLVGPEMSAGGESHGNPPESSVGKALGFYHLSRFAPMVPSPLTIQKSHAGADSLSTSFQECPACACDHVAAFAVSR